MRNIALVACSKTKGPRAARAAVLYTSALFRKSLLAALSRSDVTYILSAKHGVLGLDDEIKPYEKTLNRMSAVEKKAWSERVIEELEAVLQPRDVVTAYCGESYISPLRGTISRLGCRLAEPLGSFSLGRRLQVLRRTNNEDALERMGREFQLLMRQLWRHQNGGRRFGDCTGKQPWPNRGVYFVLDSLTSAEGAMPRIVRVGTHAVSFGSKTSLWNRLSTHRGVESGGGSHRSSIFRLHVGKALVRNASNATSRWPTTWGEGQSAPIEIREAEVALERQVSKTIANMRVIWLDIDDDAGPDSDRAYIERNSIGLLSRANLLDPSGTHGWLGLKSAEWRIAASGLWNLNHLFEVPDPEFIRVLRTYVRATIGSEVQPEGTIGPGRTRTIRAAGKEQLDFFS